MTQEELLIKLKAEFGRDFRISIHENKDGDETGRIVMNVPSGRYRPISISVDEWLSDYDATLEKFRPIFNFMMGEEK